MDYGYARIWQDYHYGHTRCCCCHSVINSRLVVGVFLNQNSPRPPTIAGWLLLSMYERPMCVYQSWLVPPTKIEAAKEKKKINHANFPISHPWATCRIPVPILATWLLVGRPLVQVQVWIPGHLATGPAKSRQRDLKRSEEKAKTNRGWIRMRRAAMPLLCHD